VAARSSTTIILTDEARPDEFPCGILLWQRGARPSSSLTDEPRRSTNLWPRQRGAKPHISQQASTTTAIRAKAALNSPRQRPSRREEFNNTALRRIGRSVILPSCSDRNAKCVARATTPQCCTTISCIDNTYHVCHGRGSPHDKKPRPMHRVENPTPDTNSCFWTNFSQVKSRCAHFLPMLGSSPPHIG